MLSHRNLFFTRLFRLFAASERFEPLLLSAFDLKGTRPHAMNSAVSVSFPPPKLFLSAVLFPPVLLAAHARFFKRQPILQHAVCPYVPQGPYPFAFRLQCCPLGCRKRGIRASPYVQMHPLNGALLHRCFLLVL
jgi:hypothetical protein